MTFIQHIRHKLALARLGALPRAVLRERLTYLTPQRMRRIQAALKETRGVPGDIVEFGVAMGGSAIVLARGAAGRRFVGFDVFAMIPPPTSEKDDAKSLARYETIVSGASKGLGGDEYYGYRNDLLNEVKESLSRHGAPVDDEKIILVKGLFEETWPKIKIDNVSLVHIDCDWYDPVRFCLLATAEKLSPGGQIIIDDYYAYGGCRRAVDEFVAEHPEYEFRDGQNPILAKRAA